MKRAGVCFLLVIVVHAATKIPEGRLPEMLAACNVASMLFCAGLLGGSETLVTIGFLFHIGVGFWAWLIDIAVNHETTPTSALVHILPLVLGFQIVRRKGVPSTTAWFGLGLWLMLQPISYFLTEPKLNVNLVHAGWEPVARHLPSVWVNHALNALGVAFGLFVAQAILRRKFASYEQAAT